MDLWQAGGTLLYLDVELACYDLKERLCSLRSTFFKAKRFSTLDGFITWMPTQIHQSSQKMLKLFCQMTVRD